MSLSRMRLVAPLLAGLAWPMPGRAARRRWIRSPRPQHRRRPFPKIRDPAAAAVRRSRSGKKLTAPTACSIRLGASIPASRSRRHRPAAHARDPASRHSRRRYRNRTRNRRRAAVSGRCSRRRRPAPRSRSARRAAPPDRACGCSRRPARPRKVRRPMSAGRARPVTGPGDRAEKRFSRHRDHDRQPEHVLEPSGAGQHMQRGFRTRG